jgi:CubicO group peptidase (beta-lactamase class C family)
VTDLEPVIDAIEHGLLTPVRGGGRPAKKLDLLRRMAYYKIPGVSIAFIDTEELAWAKGYGLVEAGGKKPVTLRTIFQAASISKPVTGMVALRLVEQGALDLDADANDFLRTWKIPKNKYLQPLPDGKTPRVTLRGLLSHTAGMGVHGYPGYRSDAALPTLQQILDGKPPASPRPVRVNQIPGTSFQYSGGGYLVVQQMIEDVTGRRLPALVKEWILEPLGMADSSFETRPPKSFLRRAATAHRKTGEPVPGKWHLYPEQAAASLWSTPSDLARLLIEVFQSLKNKSNRVLSQEMTRRMLVPVMSLGGLGFNVVIWNDGMTRFGHPGWNEGFHSMALACPEVGQGIVWMTNGENGRRLGWEIDRGLAEVVKWSWWR